MEKRLTRSRAILLSFVRDATLVSGRDATSCPAERFRATVLMAGVAMLGLIPALYARRVNLVTGLTGTARATGSPGSRRLQRLLVIAETALSLTLLIGAGLMAQSFRNLQRLDQGRHHLGGIPLPML